MARDPVQELLTMAGSHTALTLVEGTQTTCEWSVDELQAQKRYAISMLLSLGLRKGDCLWLSSANNPHCIALMLAAITMELCLCPLSTDFSNEQLARIARQHAPALVVLDEQQNPARFPAVQILRLHEREQQWLAVEQQKGDVKLDSSCIASDASHHAVLLFHSSGSSGSPKGIVYSRERLCCFLRRLAELYAVWQDLGKSVTSSARINVLPLMHFGGLSFCLQSLLEHRTVHLLRSEKPQDHLQLLRRTRCQLLYLIPSMLQQLLALNVKQQLPDLKHCLAMGEAVSVQQLQQLSAHLGFQIHNAYGMSEGLSGLYNTPLEHSTPLGSCGRLRFGEVKLISDEGLEAQEGELWVRNETLTPCYTDAGLNQQKFAGEWFRTGDRFRRDANGYYFFVARSDLMCVINGRNVYPQEVEQVLSLHPAVLRARVAPITLRDGRVRLAAAIILQSGKLLTAGELLDFYVQQGARFATPVFLMFMVLKEGQGIKTDRKGLATLLQHGYDASLRQGEKT